MRVERRILWAALILAPFLAAAAVIVNYETIPLSNSNGHRFDTLIVLGTPADPDGSPSPEERTRVLEAVREFKAGTAPHLIMSGAAAHNQFVEAHVMALFAETQGVPASAIFEEARATNTIQNIWYSRAVMREHGWSSAEVVSSPSHLPRAALILSHYGFQWQTDAAAWPAEYERKHIFAIYFGEALYCFRLRLLGFPPTPFLPGR